MKRKPDQVDIGMCEAALSYLIKVRFVKSFHRDFWLIQGKAKWHLEIKDGRAQLREMGNDFWHKPQVASWIVMSLQDARLLEWSAQ